MENEFIVRCLKEDELGLALDWETKEGWNPGLEDGACFYAADPNGFLVGELDGTPIALISSVVYGDSFAFIGLYILRPDYRGKENYGMTMARAALAHAGKRTTGLDGVLERQENYRRIGFSYAHRNVRYETVGGGDPVPGLLNVTSLPFEQVAAYDRRHFPAPRENFLRKWISMKEASALAYVDGSTLKGYGVIRRCRTGHKIGPLFAENEQIAESLFSGLAATVPNENFFLDIPEPNAMAQALVDRHGMKPMFETARMYSGKHPDLPLNEIFGITTYELG